jgi:hypothetical protein
MMRPAGGIMIALTCVCMVGGCSSRPATVLVSGSVRYEGQPLTNGEIRFLPMEGTAAPTNGSRVVAGRYAVVARGGLLPGTYRVEILSRATTGTEPAMPEEGEGPPQPPVRIPARYNSESMLEAEIRAEPREQSIDYDLTAS